MPKSIYFSSEIYLYFPSSKYPSLFQIFFINFTLLYVFLLNFSIALGITLKQRKILFFLEYTLTTCNPHNIYVYFLKQFKKFIYTYLVFFYIYFLFQVIMIWLQLLFSISTCFYFVRFLCTYKLIPTTTT